MKGVQSERTFCAARYDHVERCDYLFAVGNGNRQYTVVLHCDSMQRLNVKFWLQLRSSDLAVPTHAHLHETCSALLSEVEQRKAFG